MISKKTCTYENYCEDYNEIMYKIMILSGTVDKIYKDIFLCSSLIFLSV